MTDDPLDERIAREASGYRAPPETPREEIWTRIQAARQAPARTPERPEAIAFPVARTRSWLRAGIALAAMLLLGIGIGRWAPRIAPDGPADQAVASTGGRDDAAIRVAAIEHLGRIDVLLTDYQAGEGVDSLPVVAHALLSRTRLLLDSPRLGDPGMRKLLEDLEVLLMQVAQLPRNGSAGERALIDENLSEQAIRPRLRNAIPSGPAA